MRTPGRCSNTLTCWLATSHRDIWVPVGEEFACPVCDSPLHAPPIQSVTARHRGYTTLASAALIVMSGLAGFGVMRLVSPPPSTVVASRAPGTVPGKDFPYVASQQNAVNDVSSEISKKIAADGALANTQTQLAEVGKSQAPVLPPLPTTTRAIDTEPAGKPDVVKMRDTRAEPTDPVLKPNTEQVIATEVATGEAELFPVRPALPIPISTGAPVPPEDDTPLPVRNWHHRWSGRMHRASYQVAPAHHAAAAPSDDAAAAEGL
jgi:hypothetical protein